MTIETGQEARRVFEERLEEIQELTRRAGVRHRLRYEDREDFSSFALARILEDDCAILRKFRGTSALGTYLTVVVHRLLLDFRIQAQGKWRPCAAAKQLGPLGCQLDLLMNRDGHGVEEAVAVLRRTEKERSLDELRQIAGRVPRRAKPQLLPLEDAPPIPVDGGVERRARDREISAIAKRTREALSRSLDSLPEQDRQALALRYRDGLAVREVAAAQGLPARLLYGRLERCLKRLGARLKEEGITSSDAAALLGWDGPLWA
jgi:RNA polymerase sigma factor (sigma-70 family)